MKLTISLLGLLAVPVLLAGADAPEPGRNLFREQVRPLFVNKCLACHNPSEMRGKLDLTRSAAALKGGLSGPAVVPGSSKDSLLFQRVEAHEMPPKNPLSSEQIASIKKWIDAGAPYEGEPLVLQRAGPNWWSLRPVRRPPIPEIRNSTDEIRNPIDVFLAAKRQARSLTAAPEADRRTLIRRVTFDLTGLPPTPEEIETFLADPAPDAYERLIDRLLASPAYGERWARHWLDVVRFGESHGYEQNNPRFSAWPYRDYVIRAFNRDTPYPQFIREQLAGDTIPESDGLSQAATGFLVGGAHDMFTNSNPEHRLQQRMDDLDDIITATGSTFLGLTVNCCRCHDHKFDPLSQKDYYSLQAVFAGVFHADRPLRGLTLPKNPAETERLRRELARVSRQIDSHEPPADPDAMEVRRNPINPVLNIERIGRDQVRPIRFIRFNIFSTNDGTPACVDELEVLTAEETPRNAALSSAGAKVKVSSALPGTQIHKPENLIDGRYGNASSWISNEPGKGTIEIELARPERIDRILWSRDRGYQYRDRLAIEYTIETAAESGKWNAVAWSRDRIPYETYYAAEPGMPFGLDLGQKQRYEKLVGQRVRLLEQLPGEGPSQFVFAGAYYQPGQTHILLRGDATKRGQAVTPAAPASVGPELQLTGDTPEADRRAALARWIGSADNPLTSRVMVNRVWHYHFGQGLVNTPSDFGFNGDPPSHPELLDWLASEFVHQGWQLKPLHRLIVTSAAYRQSGQPDAKALSVDGHNRLLWRMTPRRLEAEALRDSLLAVSGRLDRRMGGMGYFIWEPSTNYVAVYKPKVKLDAGDYRRMVYMFKVRSQQDATFGVFDCPDAATARPKRTSSTTVQQALNLLNASFTAEQAEVFAGRLRQEAGEDATRQVERAFLLAFGRAPSEKEAATSVALVRKHGLPALCRALFNANEFVYTD